MPTARELAAVRVVHARRGGAILVSATRRGLDPEVVARRAGSGGVRPVRIEWPLALLALLLVPLAVSAYLLLERRRARYAIHYTNIEVLAAVAAGGRNWR